MRWFIPLNSSPATRTGSRGEFYGFPEKILGLATRHVFMKIFQESTYDPAWIPVRVA